MPERTVASEPDGRRSYGVTVVYSPGTPFLALSTAPPDRDIARLVMADDRPQQVLETIFKWSLNPHAAGYFVCVGISQVTLWNAPVPPWAGPNELMMAAAR